MYAKWQVQPVFELKITTLDLTRTYTLTVTQRQLKQIFSCYLKCFAVQKLQLCEDGWIEWIILTSWWVCLNICWHTAVFWKCILYIKPETMNSSCCSNIFLQNNILCNDKICLFVCLCILTEDDQDSSSLFHRKGSKNCPPTSEICIHINKIFYWYNSLYIICFCDTCIFSFLPFYR